MTDQDPVTGRFVKGNSANPGGRPKADLSITALIDEAITKEDWIFIIGQLKKQARRGNLKAIEMLSDRRFGKPVQQTQLAGEGGGPLKILVEYADDPAKTA